MPFLAQFILRIKIRLKVDLWAFKYIVNLNVRKVNKRKA